METYLKEISVKGLLGKFDYKIEVSDVISIIHAPNGQGKTQFLTLIDSIINLNFAKLNDISFEEVLFRFEYEETFYWSIRKRVIRSSNIEMNEFKQHSVISFDLKVLDYIDENFSYDDFENLDEYYYQIPAIKYDKRFISFEVEIIKDFNGDYNSIATIIPGLRMQTYKNWFEQETGEILSLRDILLNYGYYEDLYSIKNEVSNFYSYSESEKFDLLEHEKRKFADLDLTEYISPLLIETNRLYVSNSKTNKSTSTLAISMYSNKMKKEFNNSLNRYAELTQFIDKTFPERLLERMSDYKVEPYTLEELISKQEQLEVETEKIAELGIMDIKGMSNRNLLNMSNRLDESLRTVLGLHLVDSLTKLSVFSDLRQRVELFVELVNKKLVDKRISLIRNKGFNIELSSGENLGKVYQLSSGEQHIIVMFYKLLFESPFGSLVLIDEPELSLHSAWQLDLLKELEYISKLRNHKYIIATHSPQIVNESWDKIQDLYVYENGGWEFEV